VEVDDNGGRGFFVAIFIATLIIGVGIFAQAGKVANSGMDAISETASEDFHITPMDKDTHQVLFGCRLFINEEEIRQQADGSFSGQAPRGTTALAKIESCESGYPSSGAMLVMPAEIGQAGFLTDFDHHPIGPSLGFQWGMARSPAHPAGQQI
jgi:hypothetical protein